MSGSRRTASCPEESGRLVTAFLERFFERYVSYDFTAELEDELDDVSGGRHWQKLLDVLGAISSPRPARSWTRSRLKSPRRSMNSSRPGSIRRVRTSATRGSARNAARGGCHSAAAGSGRSSPAPTIPSAATRRNSARAATRRRARSDRTWRRDHAQERALWPLSRARDKRASIPRDIPLEDLPPRSRSGFAASEGDRSAPRDGQADHRIDRPLRALSRA